MAKNEIDTAVLKTYLKSDSFIEKEIRKALEETSYEERTNDSIRKVTYKEDIEKYMFNSSSFGSFDMDEEEKEVIKIRIPEHVCSLGMDGFLNVEDVSPGSSPFHSIWKISWTGNLTEIQ